MASNVFSKLVPAAQGRSFYEELRRRDGDVESRAGLLDEENLNHDFQAHDLEHAEGLGVEDSRATLDGVTGPAARGRGAPRNQLHRDGRSAWMPQEDDGDNDVPPSLLVERHEGDTEGTLGRSRRTKRRSQDPAVPGSSKARAQWEATQAQQRLHNDDVFGPAQRNSGLPNSITAGMVSGSAKKRAEWKWANVSNLDNFIKDVYEYYLAHGIWCILAERVLHLV